MKRSVIILTIILFLVPVGLISYRVFILGYPFFPVAFGKVWQVSMEARIVAKENKISLKMALPTSYSGRRVISEKVTRKENLDFNFLNEPPHRFGYWSGIAEKGDEQTISYRASVLVRSFKPREVPLALEPFPPWVSEEEQALVKRLGAPWKNLPPPERLQALTRAAFGRWENVHLSSTDLAEWTTLEKRLGLHKAFLILCQGAGLPARLVQGLFLENIVVRNLQPWVEVWTGNRWESILIERGKVYSNPTKLLPLVTGESPSLYLWGADLEDFHWTVSNKIQDYWRIHFEHVRSSSRWLDRLSLFHLPAEFQQAFRILLLVPMAGLIISFLRNVIGFPTFGIFMPVLMALAFRNTGLSYGLGIFTGIMLLGYLLRLGVEKLHLLLVSRLSVILTFVILALAFAALLGSKFDVKGIMAVGLLPIVILTMTIERFFILIEEAGLREAIKTVLGSALVASVSYWIIDQEAIQFIFYFYPELLFGVAGVQLLLGRYTGFRVSEIFRFRELGKVS